MTFGVGASVSQVCKYCRHAVVRTDRDLKNMGRVADLALVPSLVAVGDTGMQTGTEAPGRTMGFEIFDEIDPEEVARVAANRALTMLREMSCAVSPHVIAVKMSAAHGLAQSRKAAKNRCTKSPA